MQKIYLRYKDRWWVPLVFVIVVFLINKILEYQYSWLLDNKSSLIPVLKSINEILDYTVPVSISVLLSIIIGAITMPFFLLFYKKIEISHRKLKILRAYYGTHSNFIDITKELNDSVDNNKLDIILSNNIAGDPLYGVQKMARIEYLYGQERKTVTYVEGDRITLP